MSAFTYESYDLHWGGTPESIDWDMPWISMPCVLAVNVGQLPKAPCSSGRDGHHHLREPLDGDSGFKRITCSDLAGDVRSPAAA